MTDFRQKTILLVEDNAVIAMAEALMIKKFGYRVITAFDGETAVALATGPDPIDLILMDIDLGERMDGTQAAREILRQRSLPIIFLSGHAEREMVEKVRDITRYGYVIKNSGDFVLQSSIEMAFELFDAHQKTRQSELKYRTVADFTYDWEYWMGPDEKFIYVSPACERITGYPPQAFIDDPAMMEAIVHPNDLEQFYRHQEVIQARRDRPPMDAQGAGGQYPGDQSAGMEFRILSRAGVVRWISHACQPVFSPEGVYLGSRGSNRDISQQRQAEEARRLVEEKFYNAFLISPDSININRLADGLYIDVNQGFCKITGYSAAEVIGKTSLELNIWVDPQDRDRLLQGLRERGEVTNLEALFRFKDGRIITGLMSARIILIDGEAHILSITRDITERKREETAMRERERLYRQMFTEHTAVMLLIDPDSGVIVDANLAAEAYYGYTVERLRQMNIRQINMLAPEQVAANLGLAKEKGITFFHFPHRLASGEVREVEVHSSPILSGGRRLLYSIIHDVTERAEAGQEER